MRNPFVKTETHDKEKKHYRIVLSEMVTFLNKAQIMKELNAVPDNSELLIDVLNTKYIEHDVLEVINDFKESVKYKNIDLKMSTYRSLKLMGLKNLLQKFLYQMKKLVRINNLKI